MLSVQNDHIIILVDKILQWLETYQRFMNNLPFLLPQRTNKYIRPPQLTYSSTEKGTEILRQTNKLYKKSYKIDIKVDPLYCGPRKFQ